MKNRYKCIVSGEEKYIAPTIAEKKISKFGDEDEFRKHYVAPAAAKLLRQGLTVDEIREQLGVKGLPAVNPHVLTKQNLLRKKRSARGKETEEKLERQRYLNSKEFKDKMRRIEQQKANMTFQDWVEMYTSPGRERGGTCQRPDIFLSHNNRACDGCQLYDYCMCYQKRMSHEKRKPRKR